MIDAYNAELDRWAAAGSPQPIEDFIDTDPERISWARSLRNAFKKDQRLAYSGEAMTVGMYRPFNKQRVYFAPLMNHERGQQPKFFPTGESNHGFYLTAPGAGHAASALAVDAVPDLALWGSGSGQFFPRYVYDVEQQDGAFAMFDGPQRRDNITDTALARYRELYGQEVTADDVFFAVYGLLHSEDYRREFDADLKKMLPRIPELTDPADFRAFTTAGRALSELHIGYESADSYPVELSGPIPVDLRVTKMRYGGKAGNWDRTVIHVAPGVTISGVPAAAHEYKLGSRSALDWILERYQVKTDKASGIVNDPNDWGVEHGNFAYVVELIQRIVTVSIETVRIVQSLPALRYQGAAA